MLNQKQYEFIEQDPCVVDLIRESLANCANDKNLSNLEKFPEPSQEDIKRCQSRVTGHIRLMRANCKYYFTQQEKVLAANNAVLMYIHTTFDVFGRFGNVELKRELKEKNVFVGANLSESIVGTNAAVIAAKSGSSAWVIGDDNYADALKPYACYAFRINARYSRTGTIMLITPKENLSKNIYELFKLLESTESIITVGNSTEDVRIKELATNKIYDKMSTDNAMLIVGATGMITYVNDAFSEVFSVPILNILSTDLCQFLPELAPLFERTRRERTTICKLMPLNCKEKIIDCALECVPVNDGDNFAGCIITISRNEKKTSAQGKKGNIAKYSLDDILGHSPELTALKEYTLRIAKTTSSVLVQGESGVGKELFAHSIHCASERRNEPFVAVNCAAIPKELIGSELFGYTGGSFTGANKMGAKGKFELADKGTLFLDEIGEMPLEMQSVLLRVIEEGAIVRVGASMPTPVDVRIITATNRDLQAYVREGKFRADLYYRLNVINLQIMPLRERKSDIPLLASEFLKRYVQKNHLQISGITPAAMKAMIEYKWPGNVRELKNVIERSATINKTGTIEIDDLPEEIAGASFFTEKFPEKISEKAEYDTDMEDVSLSDIVATQKKEIAWKLLMEYGGNKTKVAKKMGVSRSTLYRMLKE